MAYKRKKVEIIVETPRLALVVEWLPRLGVSGYTTIRDVGGFGRHGPRQGSGLSGVFSNTAVLVITTEALA